MKQADMYYRAVAQAAEVDQLFLQFVKDGLTRDELHRLIERRPALWSRFDMWLDKLPSKRAQQ